MCFHFSLKDACFQAQEFAQQTNLYSKSNDTVPETESGQEAPPADR
jgi:hypothetical protein